MLASHANHTLSLTPAAAVEEAMTHSAALRRIRAQTEAAEARVREAARANLPTISLNAFHLEAYETQTDFFGNEDGDWVDDSRVGFSLSQDLFTGGRARAQRNSARARLQSARADTEFERLVITDAVLRSLAQTKAQQQAGLALLRASREARLQLDGTLREYELGTKTLTDLVLATEDYYTATVQETNARFAFYSSLVRLYAAMSLLTDFVND
jgi:outer membrane protein